MIWWKEIIGITATLFIIVSFITKNMKRCRIINLIGSVIFVVYGVLISSWSTSILNVIMIGVHIYYLVRGK